jgi:hypothetical protein
LAIAAPLLAEPQTVALPQCGHAASAIVFGVVRATCGHTPGCLCIVGGTMDGVARAIR